MLISVFTPALSRISAQTQRKRLWKQKRDSKSTAQPFQVASGLALWVRRFHAGKLLGQLEDAEHSEPKAKAKQRRRTSSCQEKAVSGLQVTRSWESEEGIPRDASPPYAG